MKIILNILFLFIGVSCFGGEKPVHKTYKSIPLKDGYTLAYKQFDSINYACLIKDGKEIEVVDDEADTSMPLSSLGYVYADYDKVFVLATHIEANPIEIQIVDKSTGGATMYGATPFYTDTVKNLMMFEGNHRRAGKLILYDFRMANQSNTSHPAIHLVFVVSAGS